MSLSAFSSTLDSGARASELTETYDIDTRGRKGLVLITDVSAIGNGRSYVQGAAVSLPFTVTASSQKNFIFNGNSYAIANGVYTTLATLATAVGAALTGATPFSSVVTVTESGTGLKFTNVATGVHAEAFAVGATFSALVALGITAAWTIAQTGAAGADGAFSQTITILGVDPVSNATWTILAATAQSTVSTKILQVAATLTAAATLVANHLLPSNIRVSITHTTTNSVTRTHAIQLVG